MYEMLFRLILFRYWRQKRKLKVQNWIFQFQRSKCCQRNFSKKIRDIKLFKQRWI